MSTRRMGLLSIPQDEWLTYPKLIDQDEEIPHCVKHTFMSLHARADENRTLTIVSKQATKMLSGKSGRTFRDHLKQLREFGLIGTSKTNQGTYIEFYSPWLRYTRIRQKQEAYSVEPNSWIHPRIAQYMHIAGKFPSDLKKLTKEYHTIDAVEKAMESLAWDVIHRDLAENGYAYVPDKKYPGVYQLVMYKGRGGKLVHDNSYLPKHRDKAVWAVCVATGKKTRITFERSVVEAVEVNNDLREAVETRDSFDTQAYALGYRMGSNARDKQLHTSAMSDMMECLADNQAYQSDTLTQWAGMTSVSGDCGIQGAEVLSNDDVMTEKLPILVNDTIEDIDNNKLISSLYIFHKEINRRGIRFATLRSCTPKGGNCKKQNAEETETTEETLDSHFYSGSNHFVTENKENITETTETATIDSHFPIRGTSNVTKTEENFTETTSEVPDFAFSESTPSNTDKTVRDSVASEDGSASNTDKVVGDSQSPWGILNRIREKRDEEQKKQETEKLLQKQKRADRKARKALRDVLAGTDIKISNLTSDAGADKLIADVCSHGLATDPDKVLPAWTVKHPAVRAEEYEASKQKAAELDKDVSWMLNVATARKNAALTLTEPLESLSWRCTASHTHQNHERSLNALKRFKAKFNHPFYIHESLKKHYPDCYRDQK